MMDALAERVAFEQATHKLLGEALDDCDLGGQPCVGDHRSEHSAFFQQAAGAPRKNMDRLAQPR
jgi:hypothetical protein